MHESPCACYAWLLLPIRDIQVPVRRPWAHRVLVLACIVVFGYQIALGDAVGGVLETHGLVPGRWLKAVSQQDWFGVASELPTLVTATFLHAGYLHLGGNMLYLWVFGERVEGRLGSWGFLLLFVGAALTGAVAELLSVPNDWTPVIGASGAVAGVLGIFVVLFPTARITTLFPALVTLTFIELPAVLFVGLWAAQQALNGYLVLAEGLGVRDVAWFAHLGGFGFGLIVGSTLRVRA